MENNFSKRILHIYSSWTAGGAEKILLSLARGLEDKGFTNIVASPRHSYLFQQAQKLGLAAYPVVVKGSFDPFGIIKLWRIVRKENIDILHAHQGKVFWPCVIIKLFGGSKIKVVFHRHAELAHARYSRMHYRWADRVIAISKAVAWGLREREKVPETKLRVVYNGTDFNRFNRNVPAEEVLKKYDLEGKIVIGTVAAMNRPRGKGQEYLIEAAQLVKERFPQARYLIVGDGPILNELKALAKKLRVADEVIFTGYQEEVEKYIAAMHLFCFLSWDTEGFGQVMVEAQAMGKPVIGTTIGGIPETFEDNVTGVLIPPKDSELLAQQIIELLDDKKRRRSMEEAAVPYVHAHFSHPQMVENVIKVYKEIYATD